MEKIAVIGIGKLGLCFALLLEKAGYEVLGIDIDEKYINKLSDKSFHSNEPGVNEALKQATQIRYATQISSLLDFDPALIFITVPTPTHQTAGYDHSLLDSVLESIYQLNKNSFPRHIIIQCTVLPGYCDSQKIRASQYSCFISYKPEFIAQGSIMHNLQFPDQLLLGTSVDFAVQKILDVYALINLSNPPIHRMSYISAEIAKLATNCFLTMKIAFSNAIGDLAHKVGADKDDILALVGADSRIGNKFLKYGFGFGGPCFPRDNRALNYFAAESDISLHLSSATELSNQQHLEFQYNEYMQKYNGNESIDFYTVTYKPGIPILEESQSLALAIRLARENKKVVIHDSAIVIRELRSLYGDLFKYVVID